MFRRPALVLPAALSAALALAACTDGGVTPPEVEPPLFGKAAPSSATAEAILDMMDAINAALEAQGADYRAAVAEYITPADGGEAGATLIARSLGNKHLGHDFVPFDPRRAGWSGPVGGASDDITFAIDQTIDAVPPFGGLAGAQTTGAIQSATATWNGVQCSNIPLNQNLDLGLDLGIVAFINGLGGSPFLRADIQHAGWQDINFVGSILAVTFTFVFVGPGGLTDVDGNGRLDTAFREIYYDPSWLWAINGNIDVETVALHEIGHGLSQAHFGNIFVRNSGSVGASPRAVMNPFYFGVQQNLLGTDNAGHCSDWAQWPNN